MQAIEEMEGSSAIQISGTGYDVVHKTNRRMRICVPRIAKDSEYASKLKQVIDSFHLVSDVRINSAASSIAIEYENQAIKSSLIQEKILTCIEQVCGIQTLVSLNLAANQLESGLVARLAKQLQHVEYKVVHQLEWRIRVCIPRLAEDSEYAHKLKYLVESINGVTSIRINPAARSIVVEYDKQGERGAIASVQTQLFEAIQQAQLAEIDSLCTQASMPEKESSHDISYWERLGPTALSLTLSLGALLELPFPSFLLAGAVFAAAIPLLKRALDAIQQECQLTIDFLDGLAVSLHTLQGHYFAPSFMLGLIEGGELIRDMTARGSERASLDLLDSLGKYALVERDGIEIEIAAKEIVEGDRVIVYPGDLIPVDGYIVHGTGLIDQCKLTGESVPVTRVTGEEVFASTLLVDGRLCILVERTGNNTRAGVIMSLMQSAPVHDTRMENYAAMVANQAVVPTLLTAFSVGMVSGDLNRAISLLTLDVGTGIRVSVPTTIMSALTYAARNGVLIRSGRAMEILARIDTVVFDKTGTLTQGHAGVTDILLTNAPFSAPKVLALAASAEQGLTHPVAEAIVRHAKNSQVSLDECEAWEYQVGLGVAATINSMQILVGSHRLMAKENICLDYLNQHYPDIKSGRNSLVYVAGDGQLLGVILYSDPPRPESKGVIQELVNAGITPYMLSGDVTRVAKAVGSELGMDPNNIYAEAFPERKVEVVKSLHESGKIVAFCGDGINDSAALAHADVSISFAGATDIARETADVVLMKNDLQGLVHAIKVAKQAMEIIWQNTALVAIPNFGALIAGIFIALDPMLAIIINNGSAILAELNGLRPLLGPGGLPPLGHSLDAAALVEEENRLHAHVETRLFGEDDLASTALTNGHLNTIGTARQSDCESQPALSVSTPVMEMERVSVSHLQQHDLAKRLGLNSQTLSHRQSKPDFIE